MRRREFITLVGGAAASWPLVARAQQSDRMRRIGVLMLFAQTDQQAHADYAAFTTELQRVGWTEGQNIRIDQRWANGDVSRLQASTTELVDLKPDLVVVQGSAALAALQHATRTLPIIFAEVTDPVGQGFVESLARPGGNTTGFAMFELSMGEKWLDLLKKLSPSTKQVAILSNPVTSTAPLPKLYFQSINAAAPRFGIKSFSLEVDDKTDLERMLSDLARDPSNGLIVLLDAFTYANRDFVIDQVAQHRIPAIYTVSNFAEAGGLASYGVDLPDQFGRAATYVDRKRSTPRETNQCGENPAPHVWTLHKVITAGSSYQLIVEAGLSLIWIKDSATKGELFQPMSAWSLGGIRLRSGDVWSSLKLGHQRP